MRLKTSILASIALGVALVVGMTGCSDKERKNLCLTAPAPAGCNQACDADKACPPGLSCVDGKCALQCTPNGNQCGSDGRCTAEGTCQDDSIILAIIDFPLTKWILLILAFVMPLASEVATSVVSSSGPFVKARAV